MTSAILPEVQVVSNASVFPKTGYNYDPINLDLSFTPALSLCLSKSRNQTNNKEDRSKRNQHIQSF